MWNTLEINQNNNSAYPVFKIHQNGYPADVFDTHCRGYMHIPFSVEEWLYKSGTKQQQMLLNKNF